MFGPVHVVVLPRLGRELPEFSSERLSVSARRLIEHIRKPEDVYKGARLQDWAIGQKGAVLPLNDIAVSRDDDSEKVPRIAPVAVHPLKNVALA